MIFTKKCIIHFIIILVFLVLPISSNMILTHNHDLEKVHSYSPVFSMSTLRNNYMYLDDWAVLVPEEQGMNSSDLDAINTQIIDNKINIHSMVILRYGTIVYEQYYQDPDTLVLYDNVTKHNIWSCTKSFMSTLLGIAMDQGYIENLDQKVLDSFPNMTYKNVDARKEAMTIKHLLTMTTGVLWLDVYHLAMMESVDPVQFYFNLSMTANPGTLFDYNDGAPHILGKIIEQKTGMSLLDFAAVFLFEPLGITESDYVWDTDSTGQPLGGIGLHMTPRTMAKLGQLYLNNGKWNSIQIISESYVLAATTNVTATTVFPYGYGYLWWVSNDWYEAYGLDGQVIAVVPDKDLVIIFTSGGTEADYLFMDDIIDSVFVDIVQPTTTTTSEIIDTTTTSEIKTSETPSSELLFILPLVILAFSISRIFKRKQNKKFY